ncbi:unnamed protein product [Caretta caretta]
MNIEDNKKGIGSRSCIPASSNSSSRILQGKLGIINTVLGGEACPHILQFHSSCQKSSQPSSRSKLGDACKLHPTSRLPCILGKNHALPLPALLLGKTALPYPHTSASSYDRSTVQQEVTIDYFFPF